MMIHPKKILFLFLFISCAAIVHAQHTATLPDFTIVKKNGKVFLRWISNYPSISQITIQRSKDANKANFKSLISLPDPSARENGYYDMTATSDSFYYRLYVQVSGINYFYTQIKRPVPDTANEREKEIAAEPITEPVTEPVKKFEPYIHPAEPTDVFKDIDSTEVIDTIVYMASSGENAMLNKRIVGLRRPSVIPTNKYDVRIKFVRPAKPKVGELVYPSKNIYTIKDGNVLMDLPLAVTKKYSVTFQDENGNQLFDIPQVEEPKVTIDKVNFLHTGWFIFKLYEDGRLKEVNRVFIPKE